MHSGWAARSGAKTGRDACDEVCAAGGAKAARATRPLNITWTLQRDLMGPIDKSKAASKRAGRAHSDRDAGRKTR